MASGSAYRAHWQGSASPSSLEVLRGRLRPSSAGRGRPGSSWSGASSWAAGERRPGRRWASSDTGLGEATTFSLVSRGRTPSSWVTAAPLATRRPTTTRGAHQACGCAAAALPARRMMVARGQRVSATGAGERVQRRADHGRVDVAAGRRRARSRTAARARPRRAAARPRGRSRPTDPGSSWVSSSTLRWEADSRPRASRVAAELGVRRSWCGARSGRRADAGRATRPAGAPSARGPPAADTLRQWCQAMTKASRTAAWAAGQVAGQGVGLVEEPLRERRRRTRRSRRCPSWPVHGT